MSLYPKLYDWQQKIVDHAASKKSFGLFLDMGLGKTVQALAIAEKFAADKILVVTKKTKALEDESVRGSWRRWALEVDGLKVLGKKDVPSAGKEMMIVNYEACFKRVPKEAREPKKASPIVLPDDILAFIKSCRGKRVALILDESHCIKDPESTQTRALFRIKRELRLVASDFHTDLLTGTPFTTDYIDIWNQLKFMDCPMTKTEFKDRFCILGNIKGLLGWQQPIVGYKNVPALFELVHEYAVTVKSSDVVCLPEQIFTDIEIPRSVYFDAFLRERVTDDFLKSFLRVRDAAGHEPVPPGLKFYRVSSNRVLNPWFRNAGFPDNSWLADTPALLYMRARQLSIGFQGNDDRYEWFDKSRFEAIGKYLADNPGNYVIFYNFTPEFYELFNVCESLGYNIDVYNGHIKSTYWFDKYVSSDEAGRLAANRNVIIANFASGSTGMNWQAYRRCLIVSLPVYRDWAQGLKRVHRVGSTEPVEYIVFQGDNWLDKRMRKAIDEKTDYTADLFARDLRAESGDDAGSTSE